MRLLTPLGAATPFKKLLAKATNEMANQWVVPLTPFPLP